MATLETIIANERKFALAYRKRTTARRATSRSTRSYSSSRRRSTGRRAVSRRSTSVARTVRIVIEQGGANPVARPLGMVPAPRVRKPSFA